ncbi:PadR family transcriptional regulator [Cellulosimicrobium sp. CUA-896]|uniref:PadR family transcriptional regulator n=1 Tax=Cellulosimicrobium sp. CUA-896 TaxID=1517881 RepID=UPI000969375A|nr:PadR family transcriptional regulator [Cellulosimicrobium sp. CUA-896]OLT55402.1 PadR family transcriptional regulator [Cellulosimicrobium sp. CUA-896]
MTTVFGHGQLRLYLLALLTAGPKHGYELITELSERFGGTYRPSAGTIYPRLARLEEEGLVRRTDTGRRSTYALTPAGRAEVEARRADLVTLEQAVAVTVRRRAEAMRADVQGTLHGLRAELAAAAQSARARPPRDPADPARPRAASRGLEAEAMLRRFADDVRADLHRAGAAGTVTDLTLDTLSAVLDGARRAVRATLR